MSDEPSAVSPAFMDATYQVGAWMSAALDDPKVCDAMKSDIRRWFDTWPGLPFSAPKAHEESKMTEDQIKYMVDRFLGWRLPENFQPDAGISFKPMFNEHTAHPMKHEPVGTNLFDCNQADAMVRHMLAGLPNLAADGSS